MAFDADDSGGGGCDDADEDKDCPMADWSVALLLLSNNSVNMNKITIITPQQYNLADIFTLMTYGSTISYIDNYNNFISFYKSFVDRYSNSSTLIHA